MGVNIGWGLKGKQRLREKYRKKGKSLERGREKRFTSERGKRERERQRDRGTERERERERERGRGREREIRQEEKEGSRGRYAKRMKRVIGTEIEKQKYRYLKCREG